jgi:hypothetical protein
MVRCSRVTVMGPAYNIISYLELFVKVVSGGRFVIVAIPTIPSCEVYYFGN